MLHTQCPECQTFFRVAPEQLQARQGVVKCGRCMHVFNAISHIKRDPTRVTMDERTPEKSSPISANASPAQLTSEQEPESTPLPLVSGMEQGRDNAITQKDFTDTVSSSEETSEPTSERPTVRPPSFFLMPESRDHSSNKQQDSDSPVFPVIGSTNEPTPLIYNSIEPATEERLPRNSSPSPREGRDPTADTTDHVPDSSSIAPPGHTQFPPNATPLEQARSSGLIAPRDTSDIPGYNKWSEAALDARGNTTSRAKPIVTTLVVLLLCLLLATQILIHFRTDVSAYFPAWRPWLTMACESLGCQMEWPRHPERLLIDNSDLQQDPQNGLLIFSSSLRNQAPYPQTYPHLELTLTNNADEIVVRKILAPDDYLSAGVSARFEAQSEIAVRLWMDPHGLSASGYRIYVFYP